MKDTPSPYLVTPEMVRAALDEHVQYFVPTSDINTPYRVEVQNALQSIADHINKAVNAELIHGGAGQSNRPETPTPLDGAACSQLADYLESPPPYRKHCTKGKLWLVLDAHGDSVLWSDQELAVDAAVEALNEMTMPRETFGPTVGRILSANDERIHGGVRDSKSEPAFTPLGDAAC